MTPGEAPVDFGTMSPKIFRSIFQTTSDYEEVQSFDGADRWNLYGVFTVRDRCDENKVATRLAIVTDGRTIGYVDLSSLACIQLASHLLEYAVASSNVNGEPQAVADELLRLFEKFLSPKVFNAIVHAVTVATEEIVAAKLQLRAPRVR
jgi:hypothetical protein